MPRTPDQRSADAFTDLVRLAVGADKTTSGREDVRLFVTTTLETLTAKFHEVGVDCGTTETGQALSAETIRRHACDTNLIPAVMSANGEPLDIGRQTRVDNTSTRRALMLRDRGCAFPGCRRPGR